MKKVAILLADGFEEIEAFTPLDVLRRADIECDFVGINGSYFAESTHGVVVKVDKILDKSLEEYDAIVLPGGMPGARNLSNNDIVIKNIVEFNERNKIIAAICAAPALVLEFAGVIEGRTATCYQGMEHFMRTSNYINKPVVIDDNIITSRGPATAMQFAYAILEALGESSEKIKEGMLYKD